MSDTNLFWRLRGNYEERKRKLSESSREYLEAAILDSEYNSFLRPLADYGEKEAPVNPAISNGGIGGKRIPYIGWFWRHVEFSDGTLPIGNCGSYIGIIANNKWDHPERTLTPDEFKQVMTIIDEAMRLNEQGGILSDICNNTNGELEKLWPLFQTFKI